MPAYCQVKHRRILSREVEESTRADNKRELLKILRMGYKDFRVSPFKKITTKIHANCWCQNILHENKYTNN